MDLLEDRDASRADALAAFIRRHVARVAPLARRHHREVWLAQVTGRREHAEAGARLDAELRRAHACPESYALLRGMLDAGGVADARLQRQLVLLVRAFQAQRMPPAAVDRMVALERSIQSRFERSRAARDGAPAGERALRRVLRVSDDGAARRRAWEALKRVGAEVEDDLLALVRERNAAARAAGARDHHALRLAHEELDEDELSGLLDAVERATCPVHERWKRRLDAALAARFGVAPAALRPWHHGDPFLQEAPAPDVDVARWFADAPLAELAARCFDALGLPVRGVLARSDLRVRADRRPRAFCLSIDRGADVRVACTPRPDEHGMSTLLHELGHAAYDVHVDRGLPWLLRTPAHTLLSEASALLFGRLARDPAWLARWAGMPAAAARDAAPACARAAAAERLVRTRWQLVMCHMERALYRDPEQDLRALWWDLVERFQGVRRPDGRDAPDWASKIHFSVAPMYYHDYLLGGMAAARIERHLVHEVLGGGERARWRRVAAPEVGAFLRERLYAPGAQRGWRDTLARALGRPDGEEAARPRALADVLDVAGFVDGMAAAAD